MSQPKSQEIILAPQIGPQTEFLKSKSSICIFGGAAGGGKTFALLLEILRHYNNSKFGAVIFRRNTVQVRNEGGLWNEAMTMYARTGAHFQQAPLQVTFPSGARVKFAHLENEKTVYDWQGAQIPLIAYDELTHFTESQFFYMMSRNRSSSGVPGYIRATCNPDSDSWVRRVLDWWIGPDGKAIPDRSGKLRWFIRKDNELVWANSSEELVAKYGSDQIPKSLTFIPSYLHDNKILMEKDPGYLSNLMALAKVDRERLLGGNWNIRPSAGNFFKREWFEVVDAIPANHQRVVRYWDRAATKPSTTNPDPDYTAGLKLYKYSNGTYVVGDMRRDRNSPLQIEQLIKNTAGQDSRAVKVCIEQDPGSSGVADAQNYVRLLAGYKIGVNKPTKDKETRALAVSAQCEAGNIKVMRGPWNDAFFSELENFPEGAHDDQVDVLSGAFNEMCNSVSILNVL